MVKANIKGARKQLSKGNHCSLLRAWGSNTKLAATMMSKAEIIRLGVGRLP
jgi:hypothetical protein